MLIEIQLQKDYLKNIPITTIYFGGGTPSLLTSDEINILIENLYKNFNINQLLECTLEANPDDLNKTYLRSLKTTLIDRLSIGVQSFKDEDLRYMKRTHNANEADYAIKAAQDAGYDNLNIDLIYGTPNLTDNEWKENLSKTSNLDIPHFSAYALTVEDKTALKTAINNKKSPPVDPDQAASQFEILMEYAAIKGYDHYEISNLAKPGKYAIHNTNYWRGNPYLGIGPSAHSFNGLTRKWNIPNNALYSKSLILENKINYEEEHLTQIQHLNEYIMTSLRTMWGCDLEKIKKEWCEEFANSVEKNAIRSIENNTLIKSDNKLILSFSGKLFADRIASELFL